MFGPDICGATRRTHLIFNYKGQNYLIKKEIRTETDTYTHLFTLVLNPDNTFQVLIDGKEAASGNLKDDFDILPPKQIQDPNAKKPSDWVDERQIVDPEDRKPEGWDDIPREMVDPAATKPSDWDDELDGEWEAPKIPNPDYKGEWRPRMIDNPAYKGEWVHPMVPNPNWYDDDNLYSYSNVGVVGFELWQVKSGTIFDNIIVTDDIEEANRLAEVTKRTQEGEKRAEEEERKAREEEEKRQKDSEAAAAPETEETDEKDEL
jgi:calreticulin